MWKLSVVICGLGHWLGALLLLMAVGVLVWPQKLRLRVLPLGFLAASFLLFLPLVNALSAAHRGAIELQTISSGKTADLSISFLQLWLNPHYQTKTVQTLKYKDKELLDFYPATTATPAPWVVVVHGGGWEAGNRHDLSELNFSLAAHGYGVIAVDYRLAPKARWPAAEDDVRAAVEYARAHAQELGLNPDAWAILGRSAGGQIAGSVAYSYHGKAAPKALITLYAPTDLVLGYEASEENDLIESRRLLRDYLGGEPNPKTLAAYHGASMTDAVSADSCPTLMLQGRSDSLVWFKHTERLQRRLNWLHRPSAQILFDLGPHGFDYFPSSPEAQVGNAAILFFLDQTLKTTAQEK